MAIFIMILSIIFVLTSLELLLRRYFQKYGKRYVWTPYRRVLLHIDQEVLPRVNPICRFDVNCDGELSLEPPASRFCRILILGGSATECYYLGSDASWPSILQKKLNDDESDGFCQEIVHVGNIAKSGFDANDLSTVLEGVLPNYNVLDIAILMVGAGDVFDWLKSGAPGDVDEFNSRKTNLFSINQKKQFTFRFKQSAAYELARSLKYKFLPGDEVRHQVGKKLASLRIRRQNAKRILHEVGDPHEMLNRYEQGLYKCLSLLRQKKTRIILMPQPWFDREVGVGESKNFWNASKGHAFFEDTDTYYSMEVFRQCMLQIHKRTLEIARTEQVETVDIKSQIPCDFNHYYDCIHFTNLGAEKVAQIAIQYLVEFPHESI